MKIEENNAKTHGKYRTVANMQSKSKVYIFRPFTDLDTPPHPPRVWKIGILQEMSRNSIIPDIDRDNCLASPENLLSYHTRQTSLLKGTDTITDVQMHIIPVIAIRRFKFFLDVLVQDSLLVLFQPSQYGLLQWYYSICLLTWVAPGRNLHSNALWQ